MTANTTKEKGDLLEKIVEKLCQDLRNSKVSRNVVMKGKSGIDRQIDVQIETSYKTFDTTIIIEAKNYATKVGIEIVEAFVTKLNDIGRNIGIIVCPNGFTEGALKSAQQNGVQLYQVFDHELGNTKQFIPLRYVIPEIKKYSVSIEKKDAGGGTFELPADVSKWLFHINNKVFNVEQLVYNSWNNNLFPKKEGQQAIDLGVIKISSKDAPNKIYYLEFKLRILIIESYYLKLFPASFMKDVVSGKGNHRLNIDIYSKKADMLNKGWKSFGSKEEMEEAAKLYDTSPDVNRLVITEDYLLSED